jgi:hypothetical protein
MLDRYFAERTSNPIVWPREQKGMQGGADLEGEALREAVRFWDGLGLKVGLEVEKYVADHPDPENRLHKSLLNRWLENGLFQTQIISATQWDGYFWQRTHKDAEPHIRAMAQAMYDAAQESTPQLLVPGQWHLPYWGPNGGQEDDNTEAMLMADGVVDRFIEIAKQCSVARCARVSYLTQSGVRDLTEDLTLYARLTSNRVGSEDPPHASPLEHVATPWAENIQYVTMPNGKSMGPLPKLGKFVGWLQLRHDVLGF